MSSIVHSVGPGTNSWSRTESWLSQQSHSSTVHPSSPVTFVCPNDVQKGCWSYKTVSLTPKRACSVKISIPNLTVSMEILVT